MSDYAAIIANMKANNCTQEEIDREIATREQADVEEQLSDPNLIAALPERASEISNNETSPDAGSLQLRVEILEAQIKSMEAHFESLGAPLSKTTAA